MNALTILGFWLHQHPYFSAAFLFIVAALAVTLYTWVQDGTLPSNRMVG